MKKPGSHKVYKWPILLRILLAKIMLGWFPLRPKGQDPVVLLKVTTGTPDPDFKFHRCFSMIDLI